MAKTLITKAELARRHGVSRQAVGLWVQSGLTVHASGRIDPELAESWLSTFTARGHSAVIVSLAEARRRKELAVAALREIELGKLRGELIEWRLVEEALARVSGIVRDSLLSLPERVADQLAAVTDARQVRDLLTAEIRQSLSHLSQRLLDARRPPAGSVN